MESLSRPVSDISISIEFRPGGGRWRKWRREMARRPSKSLTERELEIMQVLWSLGQARLGEIQDALNQQGDAPVAPSTVATQLNLLIHKGYVTQSGRPGRSVYVPTCSREDTTKDL